jgi:hypothetical protein
MRQLAVTTDRIDYWIRRDVTPFFPQSNVNPARDRRAALMVIGRLLKDYYNALATPVPPHLAALVEQVKNAEIAKPLVILNRYPQRPRGKPAIHPTGRIGIGQPAMPLPITQSGRRHRLSPPVTVQGRRNEG